jgi:hypothetical protein
LLAHQQINYRRAASVIQWHREALRDAFSRANTWLSQPELLEKINELALDRRPHGALRMSVQPASARHTFGTGQSLRSASAVPKIATAAEQKEQHDDQNQ